MRLNNYLNEEDEVSDIQIKCSKILYLYTKQHNYFYRGTRNLSRKKLIMTRKDRKPLQTNPDVHELLDNMFYEKFGWKVRSEGVFATSYESDAKIYNAFIPIPQNNPPNDPPVFVPVNGFKYIWSPRVRDLYIYLVDNGLHEAPGRGLGMEYNDTWASRVQKIIDSYITYDLERAMKKEYEVMFKCDHGYYLIDQDEILKFLFSEGKKI